MDSTPYKGSTDFARSWIHKGLYEGRRGPPIILEPGDHFHFVEGPDEIRLLIRGVGTCGLGPCPQTYKFCGSYKDRGAIMLRDGDKFSVVHDWNGDGWTGPYIALPQIINHPHAWNYTCGGSAEEMIAEYEEMSDG